MNKISAILPLFNPNLTHLEVMVNSLISQSFQNFELIIVDDSKENEMNSNFFKKFKNLDYKYFSNSNRKGIQESLNKCIKNATGDYIARVDADDFYHQNRFNLQVKFLDEYKNIDLCGSFCIKVDDNGMRQGQISYPETHAEIIRVLNYKNPIAHPSVMVRNNFFHKYGFYSEKFINEDYELWLRAKNQGCQFHNLKDNLTYYRLSGPDQTFKIRNWQDNLNIKLKYFDKNNFFYSCFGVLAVWIMTIFPKNISRRVHKTINLIRS
tara:strand:- start:18962 stop:19759 length:798 start_codon:yes stop_codon:yes gene_type:complete